ncbi:hypothetical protein E2C01_089317 [Portunus trituberculatus]|uniref:Uncharacterized protein n=1 Tax=Portunus trituberculatus TaxID=210409 RepID=A0A5B7J8H1_PORTR|nr:hypothetical protein [Portunus trituberculatus]
MVHAPTPPPSFCKHPLRPYVPLYCPPSPGWMLHGDGRWMLGCGVPAACPQGFRGREWGLGSDGGGRELHAGYLAA